MFKGEVYDLDFTHAGYNHQRRVIYLRVYLSVLIGRSHFELSLLFCVVENY